MSDKGKDPVEWPEEPKMELITESFSRHDSRDYHQGRIETGEAKKD